MNSSIVRCQTDNEPVVYDRVERTDTQTIGIYKCPKCGFEYRV